MINARYDEEFIFHDGTSAKNILELVLKLEHLKTEEFYQFVNPNKNDFSNWIGIVLTDKFLAEELRHVETREETIRLIKERIHELSTDIIVSYPKSHALSVSNINTATNNGVNISLLSPSAIHVSSNSSKVEVHNADTLLDKNFALNKTTADTVAINSRPSAHTEFSNMSNMLNHEKNESVAVSKELKASRNWFKLFSRKDLTAKNLDNRTINNTANANTESILKKDSSSVSKDMQLSRNWFKSLLEKRSFKKRLESTQSDVVSNKKESSELSAIKTNDAKVNDDGTLGVKTESNNKNILDSYHRYVFRRKTHLNNLQHNHNVSSTHVENSENNEHDSSLWLVLYIVLIVLIVVLLIYKLFFA